MPDSPVMGASGLPYAGPPGAGPRGAADVWPTGRLVSAVARRIERAWNLHLAEWDLNHASLPVLALLVAGPRSQRELATASGVTEQTMSRILVRLERLGYVTRRQGFRDRRRHAVHLTDVGRATFLEAGDPAVAEELSTRGLSGAQVAALREILLTLLAEPDGPSPDAHDVAGPAPLDGP